MSGKRPSYDEMLDLWPGQRKEREKHIAEHERQKAELIEQLTTPEKRYFVAGERRPGEGFGGYGKTFPFNEAIDLARADSINDSCMMCVYHEHEYTPIVIFFCGRLYIPQEDE